MKPLRTQDGAVQLTGLEKRYRTGWLGGWTVAVHATTWRVDSGDAVALVGPNGAGKSTLLAILAGLRRPTAGSATLFGRPVDDPSCRDKVGYVPEGTGLPGSLTVLEALQACAALDGVASERIDEVAERFSLRLALDTPIAALSSGMRRRLVLAQALLHEPTLLLLDEPFVNLDPTSCAAILDILREERERGTTLIVATHRLGELAGLFTRVERMQRGRMRSLGPVDQVFATLPSRVLFTLPPSAEAPEDGEPLPVEEPLHLRRVSAGRRARLVATIVDRGGRVLSVTPETSALGAAGDTEETLA